jgi:hypothetical protein
VRQTHRILSSSSILAVNVGVHAIATRTLLRLRCECIYVEITMTVLKNQNWNKTVMIIVILIINDRIHAGTSFRRGTAIAWSASWTGALGQFRAATRTTGQSEASQDAATVRGARGKGGPTLATITPPRRTSTTRTLKLSPRSSAG